MAQNVQTTWIEKKKLLEEEKQKKIKPGNLCFYFSY